jgi:hypothetical protein
MNVKELKKWLEDKDDDSIICELEEYCQLRELSLEYLRAHPFKPIKMQIEITALDGIPKKMDFGAVTVCSKCGNGRIPNSEEVKNGTYKACCESEGATLIPLRKYTEEVLKVPFDNDKWSFEEKNVNLMENVNLTDEIIYKENK